MSRSTTIYCGPYAQFHYPHKREPEEKEVCTTCKTSRRRYADTKRPFCGACGTKFTYVEDWREARPDVFQALGETDHMRELYQNDVGRVLCVGPNMHHVGRYIDPDGDPILDIASVDIEAEKSSFRSIFQDDLAKLSAEYGEPVILWGVHAWMS